MRDSKHRVPLRHAIAVFAGNGLEFYDFLTFSYFAVYIGRTFFPSADPTTSLLESLGTFGAGFLTRPIGAIVIGGMGDRIGRKPAMLFSFSLMGFAILALSLTPSYAQIGVAAPILVLAARLLQGFAVGGEVGPTTAYMAESAPPHRRGLYLSMQYATQDASTLVAGLVGVTLASLLSDQQLQDWGWRVAMILGAAIVPFGLMIRRTLPETLHAADDAAFAPDATVGSLSLRARLRPYLLLAVLGLIMIGSGTVGAYSLDYMTTYGLTTLHLPATIAFTLTIINGAVSLSCEIMSGWLSDRYGRKPVMIIPGALLAVAIVPCFWVMNHFQGLTTLYAAEIVLAMLGATSSVPVVVTLTESLPPSVRSGAVATVYAFAVSIFGGTTQFMHTLLIKLSGNPLAPAFYWTVAAVLGLVAMAMVPESAPVRTVKR